MRSRSASAILASSTAVDRVGPERLRAASLRLRRAEDRAPWQLEQLLRIGSAPTVAPWPQTTSSAKISSSGLLFIVAVGERQNGLALHAAIGLLRVRLADHLALLDAGRFVGDDVPVVFAPLPARGGVLDDGRVVSAWRLPCSRLRPPSAIFAPGSSCRTKICRRTRPPHPRPERRRRAPRRRQALRS